MFNNELMNFEENLTAQISNLRNSICIIHVLYDVISELCTKSTNKLHKLSFQ